MSLVCILIKKQKGETNTNRAVKLFSFRQKKVFPHWGKKNRHEKERAYPHDTGGTHGAQPDCLEHRLTRAVRWPPRIVLGTLPSVPRHCRKALPRTKRCRRMKPQWAGPAKRGPGAASGAAAGSLPLGLASSRLPPGRAVPCRRSPWGRGGRKGPHASWAGEETKGPAVAPRAPPRGRSRSPPRRQTRAAFPPRSGRGPKSRAAQRREPGLAPEAPPLSGRLRHRRHLPTPFRPPRPRVAHPSFLRDRSRVRSAAAAPPRCAGLGWRGGKPLGRQRPGWRARGAARPRTHRAEPPPPRCAGSCDPPLPAAARPAPRLSTIEMGSPERPLHPRLDSKAPNHRELVARRSAWGKRRLYRRHLCSGQAPRRPDLVWSSAILRSDSGASRPRELPPVGAAICELPPWAVGEVWRRSCRLDPWARLWGNAYFVCVAV